MHRKFLPNVGKKFTVRNFLQCVTTHWDRVPRETGESPSLEMFQNPLDAVLCHLLWDNPA